MIQGRPSPGRRDRTSSKLRSGARRGAQIVAHLREQIGLLPAADVQHLVVSARHPPEVVAPDDAGGAGPVDVREADRGEVRGEGRSLDGLPIAPGIAGLVEPEVDYRGLEIDQVGRAGTVEIDQEQARRVEVVADARRCGHGDPAAEAAVAEVRPVVDPAVVDQHDVAQPVARHVGQAYPRVAEVDQGKPSRSWPWGIIRGSS